MIALTGAAGKTGRALIEALVAKGKKVRGLVRRESYVTDLLEIGASEILVGDIENGADLVALLTGVEQVYHICPNMHPHELEIGRKMIDQAIEAGVEHFVYHSVLYPAIEEMPHHWEKMRVEAYLIGSGLAYTILQPTAYMQNLLGQWDKIKERGVFEQPYGVESRLSLVDLADVGEAAATVLTDSNYRYGVYQLVGTEGLSQLEVGGIFSHYLGIEVDVQEIPLADWEELVKKSALGAYQRENLLKMFRYYDQHHLIGNQQQLQMILGRPPHSLADFVARLS